ncbi:hypothetical protein WOLCODRAFT_158028 [Wolfiporia cocos MD-104 SS10]|uniref:Uncharacterized protein n=1 Tax=Wolfiporia cocos (strain MD-104) TaxID=742152 RepID=A0A2H3JMS6_WOLCO|nr:hypothetical protein WOLCODRAFT_158028 [Wolfiporia cocos MD-104 SS10]
MDENWQLILPEITEVYVDWRYPDRRPDANLLPSHYDFEINVFDIYSLEMSVHIWHPPEACSVAEAIIMRPAPTTMRIDRHLQPCDLDTATLCASPPSPPSPPLCYTAKTVGPTMPPGSSLGRRPCLADKLGTNAHHVTTSAEHLDGAAPNTKDLGGTVPPPPDTPV